jgi:hypothetical protein
MGRYGVMFGRLGNLPALSNILMHPVTLCVIERNEGNENFGLTFSEGLTRPFPTVEQAQTAIGICVGQQGLAECEGSETMLLASIVEGNDAGDHSDDLVSRTRPDLAVDDSYVDSPCNPGDRKNTDAGDITKFPAVHR